MVHERDRKRSIETTQEVEIYFNFIGKYLPPHFGEVEMTPEEIEEMKKREARKDRLHQNYLKRKVVDIRTVYKNGVTDSVIDSYRSYLKQ